MTDAETEQLDSIDFYWRPGCGFCMMLDRSLGKAGVPLKKYNIWDDPSHAATVRQHANGNETVPTVVIDDIVMVNPSADDVMSILSVKAPHLLAAG
jgi:glutaredoxin